MTPAQHPDARPLPWSAFALATLGCFGLSAAWILASLITGSQCAWMALLAALDAAWLLRLGGAAPGMPRMLAGTIATVVTIVLAHWGIVAAHLAGMLGMGFVDTALRLGPSLAWTLSSIANHGIDLAFLAAGVVLAAIASR
jgi:hypothetical protein